jgi:uncharacterized membrane protein
MRALVDLLINQVGQAVHLHHSDQRISDEAHAAYQTWGVILYRLYPALGVTVLTIALCFVALPFTPSLVCRPWPAWSTVGFAVGLGIVCLLLYVWLIAAMVRRPAD